MKVTFTGNFNEVIKQVNAPLLQEDQGGSVSSFSKLLGDLEPADKGVETLQPNSAKSVSKIQMNPDEMLARFDVSSYQLHSPETLDRVGEGDALPGVKLSAADLEPPTIRSAKRIESTMASTIPVMPKTEIASLINKSGLQEGVDPLLALSVARSESAFNPKAISADGHASKGLFQLLDSTGKDLHNKLDIDQRYDPFNPSMNTALGVNYLRYLHDIFAKTTELPNKTSTIAAANSADVEKLAVAAFNAGEGRVASAQSRAKAAGSDPTQYATVEQFLPDTTKEYVSRVFQYRDDYIKASGETF